MIEIDDADFDDMESYHTDRQRELKKNNRKQKTEMIEEPVENSEPQVEGIKANNNSDLRLNSDDDHGM